ncbi:MAG TPA: hypothetical protein PLE19_18775 [Planctomycetota bacterium]|nr:hypothetical protein [Planctomycetota bacterium]HRR82004.1 hypothetical protein [Planctomycetota bacterium]HRT94456.1 hypothetical protein [Planctomycetota bacterium]
MRKAVLSNGVELTLLSRGGRFLGLGEVRVGGVPLRSGRRPMFVEIRNPSAITLCDYTIEHEEANDTGITLDFSMKRREGGVMDWMVHSVRNRYSTADWTQAAQPAPDTHLLLELRPVSRTLAGRAFTGFAYQYRYRSESIPIYKLLDRGTWEPGGRATGCEFWMRSCFVPSVVRFESVEQFHSTEWYLPSCDNPNIFQFLPLQTELQGFTFTASEAGTLVTWATEVAHIRSLFEKPRGADEIVHLHEHCGDLGLELATAPVEVLWCPSVGGTSPSRGPRRGDTPPTMGVDPQHANLYEAARELVHETLHAQLGMRRERVTTYGMIEEWTEPDFVRYTALGVPRLLAAGMKKIGLANHFQNNMNVYGVSNMCCTVDYKFPDGYAEGLRALCDAAKAGGAKVEMWGNTSVSSLSEIFSRRHGQPKRVEFLPEEDSVVELMRKAKAPWVRNPSNAIEADHYTPVFCVMNLRDPDVRAYWLRRWGAAHDQVGLEGIFLDSSFNLSSDKFHFQQRVAADRSGATADQTALLGSYRPVVEPPAAILSQYRAHLDLMAEMQRLGYDYCNEDLGVFGIHRHGPGIEMRLGCLPLWAECIANYDLPAIEKAGADPDDVFFRGLAYRMMWAIYWDNRSDRLSFHYGGVRGEHDLPAERHLALLRAFSEVNPLMRNREILPDESGVVYRTEGRQVLWAFADLGFPLGAPRRVRDVVSGEEATCRQLAAQRHRLHLIEG